LPRAKEPDLTDQKHPSTDGAPITLRLTPAQRDLLRRAADVAGMPVSAFVLQSASQAAEHLLEDPTQAALATGVEHLSIFTQLARHRWESIPADIRQRLLSNVWCGHCRHETTITNFTGAIKGGDLLLVGKCAEGDDVLALRACVRGHALPADFSDLLTMPAKSEGEHWKCSPRLALQMGLTPWTA
jgi:uncharacterized protein (DUF1778 family)